MSCCQPQEFEKFFDRKSARKDLAHYRRKGPEKETRILIDALRRQGVQGLTLLDIGGGVGAIPHALLEAGAGPATGVEASSAFVEAAREEAERRKLSSRIDNLHGNFVELAPRVPPADIVTLDKVICCFPDVERLVSLSAERARRIYGLVYPRTSRLVRAVLYLENLYFRLTRFPFQVYVHPDETVQAILAGQGFRRTFDHRGMLWQVAVYTREPAAQ
jgi:magnesium-protoporphyrin O-methyltransferase